MLANLDRVLRRARGAAALVVRAAGRALDEALRPWPMLNGLVADVRRTRDQLLAENALLRQQLIATGYVATVLLMAGGVCNGCWAAREPIVDGDDAADGDADGDGDADCIAGPWVAPACGEVRGTKAISFVRGSGRPVPNDGPIDVDHFVTEGLVTLEENHLLAVANYELIASCDAGCSWTSLGPIGDMLFLVAGGGHRAYAFSGFAPLHRIEDGAVVTLGEDAFGPEGVADLWVDPLDDAHLYALRKRDGVLIESSDSGDGWVEVGACPDPFVRALAVDANDKAHVGCGTSAGVWTSHDGGQTWDGARGLPAGVVDDLEISTLDGNVVWAIAESALYHSEDGGRSFVLDVATHEGHNLRTDTRDPGAVWYRHDFALRRYQIGAAEPERISSGTQNAGVSAFAHSPADPTIVYVGLGRFIDE